ncbi:MAG: dTMP kinase [Opitutae bacterium]|nr:dTMP kinase [Opitutae bacterium]|tara:strand:- start:263 stop:919 length:657 start_codon:yes stop_codon:yes gene_type:complete
MTEENEKTKKGILISFEGSEGCGKSTQIRRIADRLEAIDHCDVVVTREPGGTEIGEEIRHLLMHSANNSKMYPEAELLLFAASRAQLVRELILPSVKAGKMVLCDRFLDSTTVYQGVARQIAEDPVTQINDFAVGDIVPDLTVVIDLPVEIGLERIKHRISDMPDRMEEENVSFYAKVREGYLILARSLPERFLVVDGSKMPNEIEEEIWQEVHARFF